MLPTLRAATITLASGLLLGVSPGLAQTHDWASGFERPGVDGAIFTMTEHDDGSGLRPHFAGNFQHAGAAPARSVVRWHGEGWDALGVGIVGTIRAMASFDDSSGPALYAGGMLGVGIRRWDGTTWSQLEGISVNAELFALAVYDDGSGPALYVGGEFTHAGGVLVNGIARWDGTSWSALGSGLALGGEIRALAVFDEGSGPRLFAGGDFLQIGGVSTKGLARWNGVSWTAVGGGVSGGLADVDVLRIADLGDGPALFVGGNFATAGTVTGANNVARWSGTSWSKLGSGVNNSVSALCPFDGGSGTMLYVGGGFLAAGGNSDIAYLARWNGTTWSAVGSGVNGLIQALAVFDTGGGLQLHVSGNFDRAGSISTDRLARWDGSVWSAVSRGFGLDARATCLATLDAGSGVELYAAGTFLGAGLTRAAAISRWNGQTWSPLGTGIEGSVYALAASAQGPGGGAEVFAGGLFSVAGGIDARCLARWDGTAWSSLGSGLASATGFQVSALCITASGPDPGTSLYAGGTFTSAGSVPASNIARWDGATWHALGAGLSSPQPLSGAPMAIAVYDDGSGPALYAGGFFVSAGGAPANHVARWDGANWSPVGSGVDGGSERVQAMIVFDDGSGSALYVGGDFTSVGGAPAQGFARWDGSAWTVLPGVFPASGEIHSFAIHDAGSGPALHASGYFFNNALSPNGVAQWTGSGWVGLGTGIPHSGGFSSNVEALASCSLGGATEASLFAAGSFSIAGGKQSHHIAKWGAWPIFGTSYCQGDGLDPAVSIGCPCGNLGSIGHGCAGGENPAGGLLQVLGSTADDDAQLLATGMMWDSTAIFLQGDQAFPGAIAFGDGLRCVGGVLVRLAVKPTINGAARFPEPGEPSLSDASGVTPGGGAVRHYQAWYRDPSFGFCTAATFNASNAMRVAW